MTTEVKILEKADSKTTLHSKKIFFFLCSFIFVAKSISFGNHYSPSMFIFSFKKNVSYVDNQTPNI